MRSLFRGVQSLGMNAFAGAVSLAGASEHLWAIQEGNKAVRHLLALHK